MRYRVRFPLRQRFAKKKESSGSRGRRKCSLPLGFVTLGPDKTPAADGGRLYQERGLGAVTGTNCPARSWQYDAACRSSECARYLPRRRKWRAVRTLHVRVDCVLPIESWHLTSRVVRHGEHTKPLWAMYMSDQPHPSPLKKSSMFYKYSFKPVCLSGSKMVF